MNIVDRQHRVDGGPLLIGFAAGGHVRPGGEEDKGPGQPPSGLFEQVGEHQGQVSAGGVAGHHHVPGTVALVHQVVPGLHGVLHRGGIGVLRGEAVLEGEHLPAGDVGQLGGQNTGIAQVAAGIAAPVAVEDGPAAVVAPVGTHPGAVHAVQLKGLPAHARHGGHQTAQQLLPLALLLQILHIHGLRRGGGVNGLEGAHEGVQAAGLVGLALLRRAAGQLDVDTVLFHSGSPPCQLF